MVALTWDTVGNHVYETGVDKGVLFIPDNNGNYVNAYAWNGLTKVTEKPVGGTATALYADNTRYLNLTSTEYFGCDLSAYTYPDAWSVCDGTVEPEIGVAVGQQSRKTFGFCYRTRIGNDLVGTDEGYKLHLVWGCTAAPSQKAWSTINDSPSANEFTWSVTCVPISATGYKPTSTLVIDSTKADFPPAARRCSSSGWRSKWSSTVFLSRETTSSTSFTPAAAASSTTYWIVGRSRTGNISFGIALAAGSMRVPKPAAGIKAFVIIQVLVGRD